LSNRDVAAQLFMSEATVKTHLTRIYNKVGVKNRAQLAARARQPS
jgi:DNA-binding NarL/FixJ family response regulator